MTDTPQSRSLPTSRVPSLRLGAVVAVVLAIGFLVWLLAVRDNGSSTTGPRRTNALAVSEADLHKLPAQVKHPVYWAGSSDTDIYELTRTRNGSIYIRYLPKGTELGDPRPKFTTVGTYPSATAYTTLENGSHRKDATVFRFKSGALAVAYAKSPSSVFFAFPNSPYIVEVFDPSPARARQLVKSGQVKLIR
jgi:hypothetical protein